MDNITHSLAGVALADLTMGRRGANAQRPLFVGAGIIAANLPDIDLAYSWITPAPLGYLLHHRGHTHTVAGLIALAVVLASAYACFSSVREMGRPARRRLWLLIAIALASHLMLDSLNSYGIHPFYPVDNTWYFGDAVFIFEPWLWLILAVTATLNGRSRTARLASGLPMLALLSTTASFGAIPLEAVVALVAAGGAFALVAFRLSPPARAAAALGVCIAIVAGLAVTSRIAHGAVLHALRPELRGPVVDVIRTPNPSSPLCWAVIAIELREADGEYVLWRGTLSLKQQWKAPTECASHQFGRPGDVRIIGDGRFAVRDARRQSLQQLRTAAETDCWARAWLRFGRAPVIEGGSIFDLRFAERIGQNFSQMAVEAREVCPPNVPEWRMPRTDVLK